MAIEVFMPKMSDHMAAGEVIDWLVKEGGAVEKGQPILSVMTDKATVDLESPATGTLKGLREGVKPGANVPVGETIAFIAATDESVPVLPPLPGGAPLTKKDSAVAAAEPGPVKPEQGPVRASPAVRHLAKQLGIDLARVRGTGAEGRITERDVNQYVAVQRARPPEKVEQVSISPVARRMAQEVGIDPAQIKGTGPQGRITKEDIEAFGRTAVPTPAAVPVVGPDQSEDDWFDLNPIQRLTGQRMLESVHSAPHFALSVDLDMTKAYEFREAWTDSVVKETGQRLSITGVLVKVVACALRKFPRANASFEAGRIKLHKQINIGVAVGANQGLVVPVIRNADRKSLIQIMQELEGFQEKAAGMRFGKDDLTGGTFTISNLGMFGVDRFQAIINPPESAILAMGRIVKVPVGLPDDTIALRPMMSCTLSIDHRSMDGVQGAKFLGQVRLLVENPYLLVE